VLDSLLRWLNLRLSGILTSTIGSFPLDDTVSNRKRCVDDLLDVGIDFPAYPQLRDMDKQFLEDLVIQDSGIIGEDDGYKLKSKHIKSDVPPPGLTPLLWTVEYLEKIGVRKKVKIKAPITGPFTLASYIQIGIGAFPFNTAASNPELVSQIASIVEKCCEEASKHAEMISIDEPILGIIVGSRTTFSHKENEIINILNRLKEACGERIVGTHICGRISPKLADLLLRTELDFLSHEFYDTPENMKIYSPKKLKENEKVLSVGCLSTKNPRVETPDEILEVMKRFHEYGDCLIFTPDCGFRKLLTNNLDKEKAYAVSMKKLRNLVEAAKKFVSLS